MSDEPKEQSTVEEKPQSESLAENKPAEEVSERTKERIEKLSGEKKELLEKIKRLEEEAKPSVLDSLKPETAPQTPTPQKLPGPESPAKPPVEEELFDKRGYLDEALLKKRLDEANQKAEEARLATQRIQQETLKNEEDRQLREAYKEFPQLNPNGKEYDDKFYKLTRNELIGQMMSGKKNLLEAAREVGKIYQPKSSKEEAELKETQKEQISATGTSRVSVISTVDQDNLVDRSRKGDWKAVAERIKRSGHGPSDTK